MLKALLGSAVCLGFNAQKIVVISAAALAFASAMLGPANARPLGYATNQTSARGEVFVIDLSDGTIVDTIITLDTGATEIVLSPDGATIFTTHQAIQNSVNSIDVPSASVVDRVAVAVGDIPIEIDILPDGSKLYTANWTGSSVTSIDASSLTLQATIPTAFLAYDVTASPDGKRVYTTALRGFGVFVIDTATDTVANFIPIPAVNQFGSFLSHIAITPDGNTAYITQFAQNIVVLDLVSGLVVDNIFFDHGSANMNNGTLDIVIDPQGNFAYALGFDTVHVIDLAINQVVAVVQIGKQVSDVVVDSVGTTVYVTTIGDQTIPSLPFNEIVKIDTFTRTIRDRFVIGGLLTGLAVESAGTPVDRREPIITSLPWLKLLLLDD